MSRLFGLLSYLRSNGRPDNFLDRCRVKDRTSFLQAHSPARGKPRASLSVQLSLLSILPSLGAHPATVGPVLKPLQPMLESTAQLPLRAVGLRLLSQLWANLDRSFPRLQAVLMAGVSLPKPSQTLPKPGFERDGIYVANRPSGQLRKGSDSADLEWKIARAASVRGVCSKDAARGVDLVLGIQAAIQDPNPVVSALGLESLEILCEDDAIGEPASSVPNLKSTSYVDKQERFTVF